MKHPVMTLAVFLALASSEPGGADHDANRAIEVGPEDGFLCCNSLVPFLFHGEKVLTSTGRPGVFRSEARGEHWQRSMEGLVAPNGVSGFVTHLCQAASDPRIVYALAGTGAGLLPFDGLFFSEDFGRTWTRGASVPTGFGFASCAVDDLDPRTVYVLDFSVRQTFRSTDGGATAQPFAVPSCAAGQGLIPRRGKIYVNGGPGCKHVSTDGGASFSALAEPPASGPGRLEVSPDGTSIFVGSSDGTFRSTDGGASYVRVAGLPNSVSFAFDPTNTSRVYASNRLLYASTDGGLTFQPLPESDDPRFLGGVFNINVDGRGSVYLDSFGGPFRSDDGGRTYRSLLNGFRAASVNDLAFDANGSLLVAVNNTRGLFHWTHGMQYRAIGDTLPRLPPPSSAANIVTAVAGSPSDPNVLVAATSFQGGAFRTEDGGRSWSHIPALPSRLPGVRLAFPTADRVYMVSPATPAAERGLYRSNDAGRSFARLSSLRLGAIAVDPTNPDVLYVGTFNSSDGLFKSTDGGQTMQSLGRPGFYSALAVDRRNTQLVYAGERFGGVLQSHDGGNTFAPVNSGLVGDSVLGIAQDVRGTLYVWMRGGGLFASGDGVSWQAVETGEALSRSGVEAGRGNLAADPKQPGLLYLGNAGVIRVQAAIPAPGQD